MKPIRVIGHGAFGYVYEILDRNRNCKAALKRTQKAGDVVSREFEMHTNLMKTMQDESTQSNQILQL